jgi:hypothetical protein
VAPVHDILVMIRACHAGAVAPGDTRGLQSQWLAVAFCAAGCTVMAPVAATSGVSALPAPRAGAELAVGVTPGFHLSKTVRADQHGTGDAIPHALLLVDAGHLVGLPGIVVGGRVLDGSDANGYPEGLLGYRRFLGREERTAMAVVAHGAIGSGTGAGSSYEAKVLGVEAQVDVRLTPVNRWIELHASSSAAVTALAASGHHCVDGMKDAVDCSTTDPNTFADAEARGLYAAFTAGLSIVSGRHLGGAFHGARLAFEVTMGWMPSVTGGVQTSADAYTTAGISLTVGLGQTD